MDRSQIDDIFPLTPMQEGLLFQSVFDQASSAYFLQMTLRWKGELSLDLFKHSWRELLQRHPVLRSAFVYEGVKRPLMVALKQREPKVTWVDVRHLPVVEQTQAIADYQVADKANGFDFQKDVLIRIAIFRLAEDDYRLVWSYHHILLDGWSFGILQYEFVLIYKALLAKKTPQLPAVAAYRQYIHWLEKQQKNQAIRYWQTYLAQYEQVASLPQLMAPTAQFIEGQQTLVFDVVTTERLNALASHCGATLNNLVRALWGIILGRYSGLRDVVFGAIVSGRPSDVLGIEEMVGLFINAIPIRLRLDAGVSFTQFVQTVQQESLAGESYHFLPLAEIQTLNSLGRDLFNHLLIFENYPMGAIEADDEVEPFIIEGEEMYDRTHYDLDITIAPGRELVVQFSYNAAIYADDQIKRMSRHWETAVSSVLAAPECPIDAIEILPVEERHQLLAAFNDSKRTYPTDVTVYDLFVAQVANKGDAPAVTMGNRSLSYLELEEAVEQLAAYLAAQGMPANALLAVCVERSIDMVVAVLAIWRIGCAYVPIDPEYPVERVKFMLDDAAPQMVLTHKKWHLSLFGDVDPKKVVCLESLEQRQEKNVPLYHQVSDAVAYMIYTSGSTGRPKGVVVGQASLVNIAFAWREVYRLDQFAVRHLQMASFAFDVFVGDLVRALTNGGELVICPADIRVDPPALYGLLAQCEISIFESTPALIMPLMEYVWAMELPIGFLKRLIIGSDMLPAAHWRWLTEKFGKFITIFNSYGTTETTVDSSLFHTAGYDEILITQNTPIGKPLPNNQFYVVQADGQLAPIGAVGDLYIGGIGVAQGYWNRPNLTAERFGSYRVGGSLTRVYKTGDQARWLPDGNLEFLGRLDDQVKLRGYRIELGEIETQLLHLEGVQAAVVLLKREQLVAYVVGQNFDPDHLRSQLRHQLPNYMLPDRFIWLDRLPLTHNGKVNKKLLRERDDGLQIDPEQSVAPRSEVEQELANLWCEILGVKQIGITDNFFDLGGHSLKAMQMVSRIHQLFDVKVSLQDFFAEASIAGLTTQIEGGELDLYAAIEPAEDRDFYPLSYAQKRLWLEHQIDKSAAYNMPEAYLIEDDLDVDALDWAFQMMIDRHEALRTAFVLKDGEPVQKILQEVGFKLSRYEFLDEESAQEVIDRDANQRFDLAQPPLLRASVIKLAENRHLFVMTIHHIIGDGWSGRVLYEEVMALYTAHRAGQPNPLSPLRIQYKDFALWQLARNLDKEESYWLDRLDGVADFLPLPSDFSNSNRGSAEREFKGAMVERLVDVNVVAGLQAWAQRKQTTLSNVVLTLFKLLLFQITKQADICIGVATANRNHPDLENLLGFFVNILPLRTLFSDELEFNELLDQVVVGMGEAIEHQDYPFDLLIEKLNPTRFANRPPILNVIYAFQNFADLNIDVGWSGQGQTDDAAKMSGHHFSFETAKFDLTLFVTARTDGLMMNLEYDISLLKRETAERYLAALERFAKMVVG